MRSHRGQELALLVTSRDRGRGRWDADMWRKTDRSYSRRDPPSVWRKSAARRDRRGEVCGTFGVEQ